MVCVRRATMEDLLQIQACHSMCHPNSETYVVKYIMYHLCSWPAVQHVAEDYSGRIVGYVLSTVEKGGSKHANISSLAVLRTHRRLALSTKLMTAAQAAMEQVYEAEYVSVRVRVYNRAALNLYTEKLGYEIHSRKPKFYEDGEDGCEMRMQLKEWQSHWHQHDGASEAELLLELRRQTPEANRQTKAARQGGKLEA